MEDFIQNVLIPAIDKFKEIHINNGINIFKLEYEVNTEIVTVTIIRLSGFSKDDCEEIRTIAKFSGEGQTVLAINFIIEDNQLFYTHTNSLEKRNLAKEYITRTIRLLDDIELDDILKFIVSVFYCIVNL